MSLLSEALELCTLLEKQITSDGYGGVTVEWEDGDPFYAAAVLDTSTEAQIAAKQGVTALYTVTTRKSVVLSYHDVFRRESDGKTFRVTSDGDDKRTPHSAYLDMRQVSAEEWVIPDGE